MSERIFIKIGGSYITDKTRSDSLKEENIRRIARGIASVLSQKEIELVLAHGAGAYGHIKAAQYAATLGVHPEYGWKAFYEIRRDMMWMSFRFMEICQQEKLCTMPVPPSAIILAQAGEIATIHTAIIEQLLKSKQIPLLHGDIVLDRERGFTIASTENILTALAPVLHFDRVLMISDVPGVLDRQGTIIPEINQQNYQDMLALLGSARGADVTGGMKGKVEQLFALVREGFVGEAGIFSVDEKTDRLIHALCHEEVQCTIIR